MAASLAMRWGEAILSLALFGAAPASAAGDEPICADRPGRTTPTCTVPAGHWQVETALADWSLQKGGGDRETALVLGETVIKYGLSQRSDIQVDITPWQHAGGHGGIGDVTILYKHRLSSHGAPVEFALLPFMKVPTAPRPLGNRKLEAGLMIPVSFSIGRSPLSVGLTPEIDWAADEDGRGHHVAMIQVAGVGWQVSDRLNLSADVWHQWDWDPAGTVRQATLDGSIAYLASPSLQLDGGANFGLNRNTPDVELYAGISKRF